MDAPLRDDPARPAGLPAATSIGAVHLTVTDLGRAIDFYTTRLGFALHGAAGGVARLGSGTRELLVLAGDPAAHRARGVTGLFHFAVLVPARAHLGRALARLLETRTPLEGVADHGVSEALYLSDPDGNGIEIYRDRPRAEWPVRDGALAMVSDPLDHEGVLEAGRSANGAPYALDPGTVIGHVHLRVAHLGETERFYRDVLGFDVMQRWGRSALFMSAGGYHHHLGFNTWAGEGLPAPPPGSAGLRHFEVVLPGEGAVDAVRARAEAAGLPAGTAGGALRLADPSGNRIAFVAA